MAWSVSVINSRVINSYAIADIEVMRTKRIRAGTLVGSLDRGQIVNSYASGLIIRRTVDDPNSLLGGLVGHQSGNSGVIRDSYSTARLESADGSGTLGGLTAATVDGASAVSSYWDILASGISTSRAGSGKTNG